MSRLQINARYPREVLRTVRNEIFKCLTLKKTPVLDGIALELVSWKHCLN